MSRTGTNAGLGRITLSGLTKTAGATGRQGMRIFGSYALAYCFQGQAYYQDTQGLDLAIGPGDLILVFPELPHRYGPAPGKTWSEFYLVFEGPIFDLWRTAGFLNTSVPVHHLEPVDYWRKKFQAVLGEDRRPGRSPSLLAVCRLQQVLAEALVSEETGAISPRELDWVSRACMILESDLEREKPMPAVARTLGISYESFRKHFTRIVGVSPARYRDSRIIDQACRLMKETQLRNKEIADQLGFCDEFHFSHRFHAVTGRWPRQFRKTLFGPRD